MATGNWKFERAKDEIKRERYSETSQWSLVSSQRTKMRKRNEKLNRLAELHNKIPIRYFVTFEAYQNPELGFEKKIPIRDFLTLKV